LGTYTQFRHKGVWTTIFHTYWKHILGTAISLSSTLIKSNKLTSVVAKLSSASLTSTSLWSIRGFYLINRTQAALCKSSANIPLLDRSVRPVICFGKTLLWEKLPNSRDALKLMIPSYQWKLISGHNNYLDMVTSHKIKETEMGYRGSKSENLFILIPNRTSVKEQRKTVIEHLPP